MKEFEIDDPIDPSVLADILAIDDDEGSALVGKVIDVFRTSSFSSINVMVEAHEGGDTATLGQTAHRFKGSSLQVGARRLAALCQELHAMADGRTQGDRGALLKSVQLELRRALKALERLERAR